jgi:hypothetical protein
MSYNSSLPDNPLVQVYIIQEVASAVYLEEASNNNTKVQDKSPSLVTVYSGSSKSEAEYSKINLTVLEVRDYSSTIIYQN